tara:strand:+ start:495 stop:1349 length:855 start_codon:yes stop_codon:yes gene_type:complete
LKNLIPYILFAIISTSCSSFEKKEFNVVGVVIDKFPERNELSIHHDEIPDFMMAMTMNFKLAKHLNTSVFEIGDSVHFKLFIEENNIYSDYFQIIDNVEIKPNEEEDWFADDEEYSPIRIGDKFTDVTFTNYDNKNISFSDFNDKFMFITFIFTRCPIPNMCPALIYKQKYIADKFEESNRLKVLTISFDYLYDTPEVLKQKFETLKSKNDNWMFLSSYNHMNDLYLLTKQSSFAFWGVEKNDIGHNMRTILIGPDMKFLKYYDGNEWSVKDAYDDIKNFMKLY